MTLQRVAAGDCVGVAGVLAPASDARPMTAGDDNKCPTPRTSREILPPVTPDRHRV